MFSNIEKVDAFTVKFRLSPLHISYANALRRIITSHVETVGFKADMTDKGTTSDVLIVKNDTPMSNEMLAERVGLIPLDVPEPLAWDSGIYQFSLKLENDTPSLLDVKASNFIVTDKETGDIVPTDVFFPPDLRSGDTPLISILRPATYLQGINLKKHTEGAKKGEELELYATASIGNGRDHCRFSPVSCCVFPYTRDGSPDKVNQIFREWLLREKKINFETLERDKEEVLRREFNTMAVARSYLQNNLGEPYSYDAMIESVGVLDIKYIIARACQIGQELFRPFTTLDTVVDLPVFIRISPTRKEMLGFDFHLQDQDAHTIGNSIQTWIVENIMDTPANAELNITFVGYDEGHPLDNTMIITIGVGDGKEASAKKAIAEAARGLVQIFHKLGAEWDKVAVSTARERKQYVRKVMAPTGNVGNGNGNVANNND